MIGALPPDLYSGSVPGYSYNLQQQAFKLQNSSKTPIIFHSHRYKGLWLVHRPSPLKFIFVVYNDL